MKNKYNIPVVSFGSHYFNLRRFIWVNYNENIRSRWENRGNSNFIRFGIKIKRYEE